MEEHLDPDRTKSCSYSWYRLHEPLQAYAKAQLRRSSPSTVEAVTLRQAAYVGNVGMLSISSPVALPSSSSSSPSMSNLSYSDRGHPSNLNDDIRGDLEYLACLWRSVEDVRAADVGNDTGALLSCATYMPALKDMGVCSKAAAGYWAAAKLLLLHVSLVAAMMLRRFWPRALTSAVIHGVLGVQIREVVEHDPFFWALFPSAVRPLIMYYSWMW